MLWCLLLVDVQRIGVIKSEDASDGAISIFLAILKVRGEREVGASTGSEYHPMNVPLVD